MSTDSANIEARSLVNLAMVHLDWVVLVAWNKECGERLKNARGKTARRKIASEMEALGVDCSQEYIRKLEVGESSSVSPTILLSLCQVLNIKPFEICPGIVGVEMQKSFCTLT
jgi:DNA-binding Xre family transcriptional regulator